MRSDDVFMRFVMLTLILVVSTFLVHFSTNIFNGGLSPEVIEAAMP